VEFAQNFGSGGSATVTSIGVTRLTLTSEWKRYSLTVDVPTVAGKTVGSNSHFDLIFWFSAGTTYAGRTSSLPLQAGQFRITNIQLEEGPIATVFEERPLTVEQHLCWRFFRIYLSHIISGWFGTTGGIHGELPFAVEMRATPTLSLNETQSAGPTNAMTMNALSNQRVRLLVSGTGTAGYGYRACDVTLDAEL